MEKNRLRTVPSMLPLSIKKDSGSRDGASDGSPGDIVVYGPHTSRHNSKIVVNNSRSEISVSAIQSGGLTIIPTGASKPAQKFPESNDTANQTATKVIDPLEISIKVPQIKEITSLSLLSPPKVPETQKAIPEKPAGPSSRDGDSGENCTASPEESCGRAQNVSTPLENCMSILSKVPPEVTISDCGDENSAMDYRTMRQSFTPPLPNLTLIPREPQPPAAGPKAQDVVNFNNGTNLQIIPQSVVGGVVELDELLKPYKCDMCDRAFRTQENLAGHKQQRHGDLTKGVNIKYNCKPCRKTFTNRQEWRIHISSANHKKLNEEPVDSDDDVLIVEETVAPSEPSTSSSKAEKPFACALCGRRFRSPENLKHHEMGHLKPQPPKDQIFDTVFTSSISQMEAYQTKYETSGWQCPVCDTLIYKIEEYNTHMLLHYTNMPYKCRDCPEMFTTALGRDAHYQKIHANGMIGALTPFVTLHKVVPERNRSDSDEMELMRLEEMANYPIQMGEIRPFECLVCKKRFREKKVFDYHTQLHRGERPYNCRCGKYFRNMHNLHMHEQSHQERKEPLPMMMQQMSNSISVIPQVPRLPKFEVTNNGMDLLVEGKRQLRLDEEDPALRFMGMDPDGGNLKCAMCDEEQPNRIILKQHELWHGRDGEFKCNICGKGFSSLVGIKIHKKKHLNDSLAEQAGVVEKIFDGIKESELFTEDEDSSDERRFSCRICKKRFKSKQAIPYHMLVHTGETPFVCEICERGFRSLASLKIHQRKHANGYDDDIDDPPMDVSSIDVPPMDVPPMDVPPMEEHPMDMTPEITLDSDEDLQPSVSDFCSVVMMEPEVMIEEDDSQTISPPKRPYISRKKPNDEIFIGGERFFVCDLCPKKFKSRAALTYHSATHERTNKCEECDKTFTTRMRLKKHYKARHPGVRVPSSSMMPKIGGQEVKEEMINMDTDEMNDEEEVEEEPQVFNCLICDRSFRSNHSLVLHKKYNHTEEQLKPEVKDEFVLGHEDNVIVPGEMEQQSVEKGDSDDDPLKCQICQKVLKSKPGFDYHMMIHTGEKPYECQYCGKQFRSFNYYKVHENYHERNVIKRRGRPRVNNEVCGVNLNDMDLDYTPNGRGYFECRVCGKEFKSRQGLPYHMALHMKNRIFRCLQCNLSFRNLNRFQFHNLLTHTEGKGEEEGARRPEEVKVEGEERKRGRPRKFPIFIKDAREEEVKIKKEPGIEGDEVRAKEKPNDGESSKVLIKRLPDLEDGSQQFQCVLCQRIFRSVQASTYHVMVHTGEKPFRCHTCNYGFRSQANLRKHQCGVFRPRPGRRSRYDVQGEFVGDSFQSQLVAWKTLADMVHLKCKKCDQGFKSRPALMYHCMIHTGEKPYKCLICDKRFRSMTNLNLHQKYHERDGHLDRQTYMAAKGLLKTEKEDGQTVEGEENSDTVQLDTIPECTICKKTFRTVGYMRQHQRRAHRMRFQNDKTPPYTVDGEEEFDLPEVKLEFVDGGYKCSECDKIFPTKGGYVYHSYTHSGARPYKCRRCSAEYRSSGNLKYHEKTVHKIVNCGGRRARRRRRHMRTPNNPDGDLKLFLSRIDGMQFKINKPQEGIPSPSAKTPQDGAADDQNSSEMTENASQPGNVFEDDTGGKSSPELNLPKLSYDILDPMPLRDIPDPAISEVIALDDFTEAPELETLTSNFEDEADFNPLPEVCNQRAAELEELTENLDQ